MSIQAIRPELLNSQSGISRIQTAGPSPADGGGGFGDLLASALKDANAQQINADTQIRDLVTGEQESVDEVALSVVKADLAFRMLLEIRNKLVSAFQEVMRMQV